jgi:hypothetical protein
LCVHLTFRFRCKNLASNLTRLAFKKKLKSKKGVSINYFKRMVQFLSINYNVNQQNKNKTIAKIIIAITTLITKES